jgi:Flp pilus assembly protein TadG
MFNRRQVKRPGVAVLELALILPVILVLVLGIAEFAAVFFVRHAMLNAARDAARSFSIREVNSSGAIALATERLPGSSLSFSVTASGDGEMDCWVDIRVPISSAALGDPLRVMGGGDLAVRVTMRREE